MDLNVCLFFFLLLAYVWIWKCESRASEPCDWLFRLLFARLWLLFPLHFSLRVSLLPVYPFLSSSAYLLSTLHSFSFDLPLAWRPTDQANRAIINPLLPLQTFSPRRPKNTMDMACGSRSLVLLNQRVVLPVKCLWYGLVVVNFLWSIHNSYVVFRTNHGMA